MQVVYSRHPVVGLKGRTFQNPRLFTEPIAAATKVFLDGDWPEITAAYRALGVPVAPITELNKPRERKLPCL